ncbi:NERD domain-containing protein [Glaciihabitans arcticus]|uniref:NERD domain-containing protein n=1 Tax=Glaciihabitans arcticus TaxID=2668039 RepID=A0A4Q9GQW5_9MICO|nr:nuclease-related domain-containing protein [Glaciihabitans arcticus]TBN56414.1 NERD domain-containing protein [Glaciihabitans arcticus]
MMTDGDVSARDRASNSGSPIDASHADNFAGQSVMSELLRAQADARSRTWLARVFGVAPLTPVTRPLYQAVLGELEVGDILGNLGSEWRALHALPVAEEGIEIAHLVIGPGGVYVVTTRNLAGEAVWASQRTLMVSGIRYPDIRNMEFEMGRVERLLGSAVGDPVEVSGVLAVVSPKSLTVRQKHRDVEVIASSELAAWLVRRPRVLSGKEVAAIAAAAAEPSTWHLTDDVDTSGVLAEFESLRSSVVRAWRLQVLWATAVTLVGAGSFLGVTFVILLNAIGALPR